MKTLEVHNLTAEINGKKILNGINLTINTGEIHALMGPNGSGKSTLANVLAGHPEYSVTGGSIILDGKDITAMDPSERSRKGLFLSFQQPVEIPGITIGKYLKRIIEIRLKEDERMDVSLFIRELKMILSEVGLSPDFINRYLNEGFSGGEKKRMELAQMMLLKPSFAILDEIDSGLDIDALKSVAAGVNSLKGDNFGALVITHYQRIMDYVEPGFIHVLYRGEIVESGGKDLVERLEEKGYGWIKTKYDAPEGSNEYQFAAAAGSI